MIGFDEAVAIVAAAATPLGRGWIPLGAGHRRVLAEAVLAQIAAPHADVATMDGYAVRDADLARALGPLRVVGESRPGAPGLEPLQAGQAGRIFTGAAIPPGCDRVVMQEAASRDRDLVTISGTPAGNRFIRRAGSDFEAGDILLPEGELLGPRQLVTAAAADVAELCVWRQPRVALLATGDELVAPGQARARAGSIPDSLSIGLRAMIEEWGGSLQASALLADELAPMERTAGQLLEQADLVVVTGGASVGERDFAKRMFQPHGLELLFSKVAMKPGKPVWFGRLGEKLVLGLPGNPTSAMVTARLLLAPLLTGLAGRDPANALRWRQEVLAEAVDPVGERETFARAILKRHGVQLAKNQDSGSQKVLSEAALLVRLRAGPEGIPVGSAVDVLDF